jgi:hypothetical protein
VTPGHRPGRISFGRSNETIQGIVTKSADDEASAESSMPDGTNGKSSPLDGDELDLSKSKLLGHGKSIDGYGFRIFVCLTSHCHSMALVARGLLRIGDGIKLIPRQ